MSGFWTSANFYWICRYFAANFASLIRLITQHPPPPPPNATSFCLIVLLDHRLSKIGSKVHLYRYF
jgi:hypothetical protein